MGDNAAGGIDRDEEYQTALTPTLEDVILRRVPERHTVGHRKVTEIDEQARIVSLGTALACLLGSIASRSIGGQAH